MDHSDCPPALVGLCGQPTNITQGIIAIHKSRVYQGLTDSRVGKTPMSGLGFYPKNRPDCRLCAWNCINRQLEAFTP